MSKSSPFYLHFQNAIPIETFGTFANEFFNEELFKLIMNKYAPYLPLWPGILLQCQSVSNCYVKTYFGQLKNITLVGQKTIRCSHFVRKLNEDILSLKLECDLGIRKNRLTKEDPSDEKLSQETWMKREKKMLLILEEDS